MSEIVAVDPKKKAIGYGIVLGVVSLILSIITLFILKGATSLIVSSVISSILNYVVFIVIVVLFVIALRKFVGGFWEFSTALKNIYVMLAFTAIISNVGITVFNVIMPHVQEESINNTINLTIELMEKSGSNDEQIDKMVATLDEQKELIGVFSFGQFMKALSISLILYFVFALILAAIFKREKPIFIAQKSEDSAHPWQENQD